MKIRKPNGRYQTQLPGMEDAPRPCYHCMTAYFNQAGTLPLDPWCKLHHADMLPRIKDPRPQENRPSPWAASHA